MRLQFLPYQVTHAHTCNRSGPEGKNYKEPPPEQHILRELDRKTKKLKVRPLTINKDLLDYWSPHDLLGLFLSFILRPWAAEWHNYYVPLLYVYGRWAAHLGSTFAGIGSGDPPFMVQVTWHETIQDVDPDNLRYHLGSSMAGYTRGGKDQDHEEWRKVVGSSRFDIIRFFPIFVPTGIYHFEKSLDRDNMADAGTRFGNCAETYPFATFLRLV